MRKGIDEQKLRESIAYIHGRIERELEAFAGSLALPAVELTQRVGALLLGQGQWTGDRLPSVPSRRSALDSRQRSIPVAALESAIESHGGGAQSRLILPAPSPGTSEAPTRQMTAQQQYWASKTPEQRSAEMRKRMKKWSPTAKAKWQGTGKGKKKLKPA